MLESSIDMDQFLRSIHRYVQLGVHIKGYYSKELQRFKREVAEVVEFYVDEDNNPKYKILYKRTPDGKFVLNNPSKYLLGYLESQGVIMQPDILVKESFHEASNDSSLNENVDNVKKENNIVENTNSAAINSNNNASVGTNPMLNYEVINDVSNSPSPVGITTGNNVNNTNTNQVLNNSTIPTNSVQSNNSNFTNMSYSNQNINLNNSIEKNGNVLYTNINSNSVQ